MARIHRQNLINYGVLPLTFADPADYDRIEKGSILVARDLHRTLEQGRDIALEIKGVQIQTRHGLTPKQIRIMLAGGLINWRRSSLERLH